MARQEREGTGGWLRVGHEGIHILLFVVLAVEWSSKGGLSRER